MSRLSYILFFFFGVVPAAFVGWLSASKGAQHKTFPHIMAGLAPAIGPVTLGCEALKQVKGRVVEFGVGTARESMTCYAKLKNDITHWTGVDPNPYMVPQINKTMEEFGFRTPGRSIEIHTQSASNVPSIASNSADYVVFVHLLCSVGGPQNALAILKEASRVLKPEGRLVFFEHVAAKPNTLTRTIQHTIEPLWATLLDGCTFADTEDVLRASPHFKDLHVEETRVKVPLIAPHIQGYATPKK